MPVQVLASLPVNEGIWFAHILFSATKPVLLVRLAVAKLDEMGYINTKAGNTVVRM